MKKRSTYIFASLFVLALLFIFLHYTGRFKSFEDFTRHLFSGVSSSFNKGASRTKEFFSFFKSISDLQKENKRLDDELNKTKTEIAQLKEAKEENDELRKMLGFTELSGFEFISSEITSYSPDNLSQSVLVNKGSKDGVLENMPVLSSDGFLIGRIVDVSNNSCRIFLITDPTSYVNAKIQDTKATGLIKGQIGFGLALEKIPQTEKIQSGDVVVTSGLGGDFPPGLIIGYIEEISRKENTIFQRASVRPAADFKKLDKVLIIRKWEIRESNRGL